MFDLFSRILRLFVASVVTVIGAGACTATEVVSRPMGSEVTQKIQAAAGGGGIELSYAPVAPLPPPTYSRSVHRMARLKNVESDGALVFETLQGGETRIPQRDVQSLATLSHRTGALEGLAVGAVVGVVLGVAVAIAGADHPCPVATRTSSCGPTFGTGPGGFATIPGIVGGLLGVGIGAEIGAWVGVSTRYEMRP